MTVVVAPSFGSCALRRQLAQALAEFEGQLDILGKALDLADALTEKVLEQRVRLGQHRFARATLRNFGHRCGFCGFSPGGLSGCRLLVASHIKPWRDCSGRERLDPRNGIAACPTHDAAFDGGLLTVNGGLRIHRSAALASLMTADRHAQRFFGEEALRERLLLPPGARGPLKRYLDYHRSHVFDRPA